MTGLRLTQDFADSNLIAMQTKGVLVWDEIEKCFLPTTLETFLASPELIFICDYSLSELDENFTIDNQI